MFDFHEWIWNENSSNLLIHLRFYQFYEWSSLYCTWNAKKRLKQNGYCWTITIPCKTHISVASCNPKTQNYYKKNHQLIVFHSRGLTNCFIAALQTTVIAAHTRKNHLSSLFQIPVEGKKLNWRWTPAIKWW